MVKNRVKVSICDVSYSLVGDEEEGHVFQAAAQVDLAMRTILEAGVIDREKAAVLVALQLASALLKHEHSEQYQTEKARYLMEKMEREIQLLLGAF